MLRFAAEHAASREIDAGDLRQSLENAGGRPAEGRCWHEPHFQFRRHVCHDRCPRTLVRHPVDAKQSPSGDFRRRLPTSHHPNPHHPVRLTFHARRSTGDKASPPAAPRGRSRRRCGQPAKGERGQAPESSRTGQHQTGRNAPCWLRQRNSILVSSRQSDNGAGCDSHRRGQRIFHAPPKAPQKVS